MAKYGSFKKVEFSIGYANGYGRYVIEADYKGKKVVAYTNDSEAFDYLDSDCDKQAAKDAARHCYFKIVSAYEAEYGKYKI